MSLLNRPRTIVSRTYRNAVDLGCIHARPGFWFSGRRGEESGPLRRGMRQAGLQSTFDPLELSSGSATILKVLVGKPQGRCCSEREIKSTAIGIGFADVIGQFDTETGLVG